MSSKDSPTIIKVTVYRCSVVVYYGSSPEYIFAHTKKHGLHLSKEDKEVITQCINEDSLGFCKRFAEDNRDIMVYIRHKPERALNSTLLHELYHAVDFIAHDVDDQNGLMTEGGLSEAKAFLFEYLVEEYMRLNKRRF